MYFTKITNFIFEPHVVSKDGLRALPFILDYFYGLLPLFRARGFQTQAFSRYADIYTVNWVCAALMWNWYKVDGVGRLIFWSFENDDTFGRHLCRGIRYRCPAGPQPHRKMRRNQLEECLHATAGCYSLEVSAALSRQLPDCGSPLGDDEG